MLAGSYIVFGLTDDLTNLIKRYFIEKKVKKHFCLKEYTAK